MNVSIGDKFSLSNVFLFISFLFYISLLSFPKSFSLVKLFILTIIIVVIVLGFFLKKFKFVNARFIVFYLFFIFLALIWLFIGVINNNPNQAVVEYFRLYVAFSVVFLLLFSFLENINFVDFFIKCFCYSALIIFAINTIAFVEVAFNLHLYPSWLKEELNISVGIHEGHSQLGSNNVNSLFLIAPCLFCLVTAKNNTFDSNKTLLIMALICSVLVALISGRRALIFLLALTPLLFIVIKSVFKIARKEGRVRLVALLIIYSIPFILIIGLQALTNFDLFELQERLSAAFDSGSQSERIMQFHSLLDGFLAQPIVGSGFGGSVDVIRNQDRPWLYELSYIMLLFNGGLLGFTVVSLLIASYFFLSLSNVREFNSYGVESLAILIGILVFFIGNATNPYFSGFDSLFILGFLPLLSSSKRYK